MKYGIVTSAGTVRDYVTMAREAEAGGWDGVFVWDDICVGPIPTYDPWVALGAMAVSTERITLGSMVFSLARRRPWKVARETLTLDILSAGRLVLPVGFGGEWDGGYSRVNTDEPGRRERREKLDECLAILDLAWTGESFDYDGKHYQAKELVFRPRPVQRPRIPVWTVGAWPHDRSLARSARWDGVITADRSPGAGEYDVVQPAAVAKIRDWMLDRRGSLDGFDVIAEGTTDGSDPDAAAAHVAPYREAGATWWIESHWDDEITADFLLNRIRQGPPR
ncbi:LLM class flavin-dependent oxidoreductase [Microlunatus elymi]|uniref:LLM class flavin-dependent oxidoreductase n=1 Tax=Microlunatus elymi TaxID=2596828 RepID=A0A516PWG0_9ACTN|nr:LLM class flavin-dependent oxidoreductase [Microlunatus elymi]QDP95513.1 LLM class flavin-dependent oxidoreductase [Microlunatus elymi]